VSRGQLQRTQGLTPRKEDIREGNQFKHRPVEVLQIEMSLAGVFGFIKGEELAQEVNRRHCGSATNLTPSFFNSWVDIYDVALANLQDAFAAKFKIDTAQDLHEIKTALPCFQAAFVHARE
jgi:hypothetical protein